MIIYFCLFIPLLFLPTESSSIRGRNHKNDLVPFSGSRLDISKKDPNSIKVVSKEPFILQLQMPNSKEMGAKAAKEKDKKMKKRVSKIKQLRKKQRRRRDILTLRAKSREEKLIPLEIPQAKGTERKLQNFTKNSVDRTEILKALSFQPKKAEAKLNKREGAKYFKKDEKTATGKAKKNNAHNQNLQKHHLSLTDRTKMVYPSTPKLDRNPQKYTHKDLVADRERLEKKIKYIKSMLSVNDTNGDDAIRVRRRSDSDRAANKIAKMFLTLSAVNGLHDKRKSKCNEDDDEEREEDVWEKERRSHPFRKSTSSNEERYKVKKWIEFMKNKRSSGKTCPCMKNSYNEDDAFPLEQKLPKGYFLTEKGSEESSESYGDPFYYSRDRLSKTDNVKKRLSKGQDQDSKLKAPGKSGKKRVELPFEDLELYRSRARQILQNAEEILDKIKEEEEKRLASPNILMSQLKELTTRIHGEPRKDENDLIRKIQKNLGWGPWAKSEDSKDGTFLDNVKSFILDPYEKAKALTDESTKKLSSYLLRNLGRLQESSEEEEGTRNAGDNTGDPKLSIYFGGVPQAEEKPSSASLAKEELPTDGFDKNKEDLQNWEDTLSAILSGGDEAVKESNWDVDRVEPLKQEMDKVIQEKQKDLNDYKETEAPEYETLTDVSQPGEANAEETKPGSDSKDEIVAMKFNKEEADENRQGNTEIQPKTEKDEREMKRVEDPTKEDMVEIRLNEEEADENKQVATEFQPTSVKDKEKTKDDEDVVEMKLSEKGTNEYRPSTTEIQPTNETDEKGTENADDPAGASEGTTKDSDIVKNQKFRETEETLQGIKGENKSTTSGDMSEEEEKFNEKIEKILKGATKQENDSSGSEDESEVKNLKNEENEEGDAVAEVLEKKEENLNESRMFSTTGAPPSQETEEVELERARAGDSTTDETVGEKIDVSFSPTDEVSQINFGTEAPIESENILQETTRAGDEESRLESYEEPVLEKQRESDGKQSEELTAQENKSILENIREGEESKTETESLSEEAPKEIKVNDSSDDQIVQEESATKTLPEPDDLKQEAKQNSEEYSEENSTGNKLESKQKSFESQEEEKMGREETLKPGHEESEEKKEAEKEDALTEEGNFENLEKSSKEDSAEVLKESLENQENANEPEGSFTESDGGALLEETHNENLKNEEAVDDETLKEPSQAKSQEILSKEISNETSMSSEAADEDIESQTKTKSTENDETLLEEPHQRTEVSENVKEKEEEEDDDDDETPLKASASNRDDQELDFEDTTKTHEYKGSGGEGSEEINLKTKLDEDDETVQEKSPLHSIKNEEIQEAYPNSEKSTEDVESQKENQETDDKKEGSETSAERVLKTQEKGNQGKEEEVITSMENQNADGVSEKDAAQIILGAENLSTEDTQTGQDTLKDVSNQRIENSKETLRETNSEEKAQDEANQPEEESRDETLKAISGQQKHKSVQVDEQELNEKDELSDENKSSEIVSENQSGKSLEENPNEETVKAVNLNMESEGQKETKTFENPKSDEASKEDEALKEAKMEESEGKEGETVGLDNDYPQLDKNGLNSDEKVLLLTEMAKEDTNNKDLSYENLKSVSSEQNQDNLDENYEYEGGETAEKDEETSLRSASFEDDLDNKIDYETPLRSSQFVESDNNKDVDESEETLREENMSQDLDNQIDEEVPDETVLRSTHFDAGTAEENSKASRLSDRERPDTALKFPKSSRLKVPESIRKVIKDLDGKAKDDVISMQNLNPDKIDHMLDRIGEQQNLLESNEDECRKECACAEEMNTRSRNIGRYEIVKDFLQWVKDLQLNRVLSDD